MRHLSPLSVLHWQGGFWRHSKIICRFLFYTIFNTIKEHIKVVLNYSKVWLFLYNSTPKHNYIERGYKLEGNSPWNLTEQIARMLFCDKRWNHLQYGHFYPSHCHQHCSIGVLLRWSIWHKWNEVKSNLGVLLWCAHSAISQLSSTFDSCDWDAQDYFSRKNSELFCSYLLRYCFN